LWRIPDSAAQFAIRALLLLGLVALLVLRFSGVLVGLP
jgi:hypothetical protein